MEHGERKELEVAVLALLHAARKARNGLTAGNSPHATAVLLNAQIAKLRPLEKKLKGLDK